LKNIVGSALEDLTKNANDLSSFVRKKKQPAETTTTPGSPGPSGGNKKRDFEQASLSDDESVGSKREKR
jgi:HAT1-interacting factor 1